MAMDGIRGGNAVQGDVGVALDDSEKVVEIVRDATGEAAEGIHFLGLTKIVFELLALSFVALKSAAHAVKSARDPCELAGANRGKGIRVVALLESANTFEEGTER